MNESIDRLMMQYIRGEIKEDEYRAMVKKWGRAWKILAEEGLILPLRKV